MGGLFSSKADDPKPPPVPSADPSTTEAQFEAGEEDEEREGLEKKKEGKSSLTVSRTKTVGTKKASSTSSGLSVGN